MDARFPHDEGWRVGSFDGRGCVVLNDDGGRVGCIVLGSSSDMGVKVGVFVGSKDVVGVGGRVASGTSEGAEVTLSILQMRIRLNNGRRHNRRKNKLSS